ncbi:MAG: discoidin domain-containing protein [Kiritimatiellae bacterium]|nr:discoidin domain-containing protein [Kiritimatiellia bacterium]
MNKKKFIMLMLAVLVVGIIFRLLLFAFAYQKLPLSSDEAWPGLMAMHMLKGEFPVVYWGQTYMGTQESFIDAALIFLFGAHTLTIRIYPLAFAFLFLAVSYALARSSYNREVGLITLVLLAIPAPYLAMCGVAIPPDNYLAVTTLGSIALLLTSRIITAERRNLLSFILLGAVLGYAFWLHLLIISYIVVAALFLFLKDKLLLIRKEFFGLALAFLVTSLPFWWFNWTHDFATFNDVGGQGDWARTLAMLQVALIYTVQFFIGMRVMLYGDNINNVTLPPALYYLLAAIWIGVLVLVLIVSWKRLWRLCYLSLKNTDGTALLLVMTAVSIAVFAKSQRSGSNDARYLLPILSALPILFAYGLWRLQQWARPVFYVLLAIVLVAQAWGNVLLAKAWNNPALVAGPLELPDTRALIRFLQDAGIRHAYAHYWLSYRLTYETQENLIVSEPYNERFPGKPVKFLDIVSAAEKVAFITHPTLGIKADDFETLLRGIGGAWQKTNITCFTVFYDFLPPCGAERTFREIPRDRWQVTASIKSAKAPLMMDGKTDTIWASDTAQMPGMTVTVDMGAVHPLAKIRFDLGTVWCDYPRGSKIEVSTDNRTWKTAFEYGNVGDGLFWDNAQPRFLVYGDFFTCTFTPVKAQYVRITQTGSDPRFCWTIAELRFFGLPAIRQPTDSTACPQSLRDSVADGRAGPPPT